MSKPDHNFRSISDVNGYTLELETIDPREQGLDPAMFDDLLKLSNAEDVRVFHCIVRGGGLQRENAIDLNRNCRNVMISDVRVQAGKQNAITAKGGCKNLLLRRVLIEGAAGNCDIELGNYADQSFERTTGTMIDSVRREDGKPVRIRCGDADWPVIVNSNVKILYFESYRLKLYVWLKQRTRLWFGGKLKFLIP